MPVSQPDEIKILPAYTLAGAARLIGARPSTLQIWFRGRHAYESKGRKQPAVTRVLQTDAGPREPLSFIDVVAAHVVHTIRKGYKLPLKNVRKAVSYIEDMKGDLMFLASKDFYYDYKNLFLQIGPLLVSLSEGGQVVEKQIIKDGLKQIAYDDDGYAGKFFPTANGQLQKQFAINPAINFGRLSIARLGVDTNAVADRFVAGEKIIDIAKDYGATADEVEDAIRWHDRLAIAA